MADRDRDREKDAEIVGQGQEPLAMKRMLIVKLSLTSALFGSYSGGAQLVLQDKYGHQGRLDSITPANICHLRMLAPQGVRTAHVPNRKYTCPAAKKHAQAARDRELLAVLMLWFCSTFNHQGCLLRETFHELKGQTEQNQTTSTRRIACRGTAAAPTTSATTTSSAPPLSTAAAAPPAIKTNNKTTAYLPVRVKHASSEKCTHNRPFLPEGRMSACQFGNRCKRICFNMVSGKNKIKRRCPFPLRH